MLRLGGVVISILVFFLLSANLVLADQPLYFPSCEKEHKPGDYKSEAGQFRVPGQSGTVSGKSDIFYRGLGSYYQCICQPSGSGVQVNYWDVKTTGDSYIDEYVNKGWWRVAGADWGLRSDPYLANVLSYNCQSSSAPTITPTPTSTNTVTGTPVQNTPTPTQNFSNTSPAVGGTDGGSSSPKVCTNSQPGVPMALAVSKAGSDSVKLEWTKVDQATHYVIEYGQDPDNYIYGVPNTGNQISYLIEKLDLSKRYYFRVRAVADCMPGDPSNVISYPHAIGQVLGLATTSSFDWGMGSLALIGLGVSAWAVKMRY